MKFFTESILLLYITLLPLLVFSSSVIVTTDKEKNNKNLLRGSLVEDLLPAKTDENVVGIEDFIEASVLEDLALPLSSSNNKFGNTEISIYDGIWGNWKHWVSGKGGMYACGAELQFEGHQGGSDDTAANGLKFKYCGLKDWHTQNTQTIWTGNWGTWMGMQMCQPEHYIGAARVRYEDDGGDDTALNGLQIFCVKQDWLVSGHYVMVYAGMFGSWKPWNYQTYKLVKSAKVRYEDSQGHDEDDTAMNGIRFIIEKPNYSISQKPIAGEWEYITTGGQGGVEYKIIESTETSSGREVTNEEAYGIETSISAGFSFKAVDVSATVTGSMSRSTASTVSSSLTKFHSTEITVKCPETGSTLGYYTMWQFILSQDQDSYGQGFRSAASHIQCTSSTSLKPKCPLGSCDNLLCTKCCKNVHPNDADCDYWEGLGFCLSTSIYATWMEINCTRRCERCDIHGPNGDSVLIN